ncbi:MAG: hypothetical protein KBA51_05405 [Kiritimatiellae bacterium]|nr:hypothetical protein [Kiritimatiellia bacterium]
MNRTSPAASNPPPAWEAMMNRYFDGVITPSELETLSAVLRENPDAARAFVRAARMDSALYTHFHRQTAQREWSESWSDTQAPLPLKLRLHAGWNRWRDRVEERRWWGPAGAVLAHAALIFILIRWAVPHTSAPSSESRDQIYPAEIAMGDAPDGREPLDPVAPIPRPEPSEQLAEYHPDPLSLPEGALPDPFADILAGLRPEHAMRPPREPAPDRSAPVFAPVEADLRLAAMRRHLGSLADDAEEAARRGNEWLAQHQASDGRWDGSSRDEIRTTALPLLALLQQGEGPRSARYGSMVTAGLRWLLSRQQPDGWFGESGHDAEAHAWALATVSEAYRRSRIPSLRAARDRALAASLAAQDDGGLWARDPGYALDLGATAAHMMAMDSALAFPPTELDVPEAMARAVRGVLSLRAPHVGAWFASSRSALDGQSPPPSRQATLLAAWALQYARTPIPAEVHRTIQAALFHPADPSAPTVYETEMIIARIAFNEGGRAWSLWKSRRLPELLSGQTREGAWGDSPSGRARAEETAYAMLAVSACMEDPPRPLQKIAAAAPRMAQPVLAAVERRRSDEGKDGAS